MKMLNALIRDERGAALTEYALILAIISVGTIGVLSALNVEIRNVFETVRRALADHVPV